MKGCVSEIHQVKEFVSKNDQLQCIRITVDGFFKATLSLDQFLILAFIPDRFFIGGIKLFNWRKKKKSMYIYTPKVGRLAILSVVLGHRKLRLFCSRADG